MWKQDINRIRLAKASDSTGNVCNKMWNKYIYIFKGIKEKDIVRSKDQESKTFPNSSFKRAFVLSRFSRVWLFVTLCTVDGQSSSVHGLRQARILEWLPCPPPGKLPNPEIDHASLMSLALVGRLFTTGATWENLFCLYLEAGGGDLGHFKELPWIFPMCTWCVYIIKLLFVFLQLNFFVGREFQPRT